MRKILINIAIFIAIMFAGAAAGFIVTPTGEKPQDRTFIIKARQYSFDPEVIKVNKGDKVTIKLVSEDVTHGFYLEGYDLDAKVRPENPFFWVRNPSKSKEYREANEIKIVADKTGKFRYRCSITCGSMHPFMQGEMIVRPNYLFPIAIGMGIGLIIASIILFYRKRD